MFTLDTNILIYYSEGDKKVLEFLNENNAKIFYIPSIVATEFLSYPLIKPETIMQFKLFLTQTLSIGLDLLLAEQAAEIRRIYNLKLADSIVAASSILTQSILVTRNIRDFKKIPNLKLLKI